MVKFLKFVALAAIPVFVEAAPLPRFPPGAVWNQDVSSATRHPSSDAMISWLQSRGGWGTGSTQFQIDFSMVVLHADAAATTVPVAAFPPDDYYSPDCEDPGMAFPLPSGGAIEGSSGYACDNEDEDCHLLVVQGNELFESYHSNVASGRLQSQCAVRWDLTRVYPAQGRGEQCTSVDAAGYPVSALLFNADEVYAAIQSQGDIGHAIRFILPNSRMRANMFVAPATHAGGPESDDPNSIPYGSHFRLRADFDIDGFSDNEGVRAILRTLKKYGMYLADGGNLPLTAEADTFTTHKWDESGIEMDSHSLYGIQVSNFEVVASDAPIELTYDCVRLPEGPPPDPIYRNGFDQ